MGKCFRCGREVNGWQGIDPMPICPECELAKQGEQRAREEEARRQEDKWDRHEQEMAAQARHEEELKALADAEEARAQRHKEELNAIKQTEEAQQRRFDELQRQEQQDRDFENAKMSCRWCSRKYTFRNGEGFGVYCSKKCAVDDLGQTEIPDYLDKTDALLQEITNQYIKEEKYLNAIISAEGCKNLPADIKGQIGHYLLTITNRNIKAASGEKLLKEAVIAGSADSAKLFLQHYLFADLSSPAYSETAKLLLPHFETLKKEFASASDSPEKIDALEDILHKWQGCSIAQDKISCFIRQKRTGFIQAEYDVIVEQKAKAQTSAEYYKVAELFDALADKNFKDSGEQAAICRYNALQIEYEAAVKQKEKAVTADEYCKVAELFDTLADKNFKDSGEQATACRNMALQIKIQFAGRQEKNAKSFEDCLDSILLYLELNDLNVENADSWFEHLHSKAISFLDTCNSPDSRKRCMQKIKTISSRGFPQAELLQKSYTERLEALWQQALIQAENAKTEDECKAAIDFLEKFKNFKKGKAVEAIKTVEKKLKTANERWFGIFAGAFFIQLVICWICCCIFFDMSRFIYWIIGAVLTFVITAGEFVTVEIIAAQNKTQKTK